MIQVLVTTETLMILWKPCYFCKTLCANQGQQGLQEWRSRSHKVVSIDVMWKCLIKEKCAQQIWTICIVFIKIYRQGADQWINSHTNWCTDLESHLMKGHRRIGKFQKGLLRAVRALYIPLQDSKLKSFDSLVN